MAEFVHYFQTSKDSSYDYIFCWLSLKWSNLTCKIPALIIRNRPQPFLHAAAPLMHPMFTENMKIELLTTPFLHTEQGHIIIPMIRTRTMFYVQNEQKVDEHQPLLLSVPWT